MTECLNRMKVRRFVPGRFRKIIPIETEKEKRKTKTEVNETVVVQPAAADKIKVASHPRKIPILQDATDASSSILRR